jgi:antitoxin (DNA-binding transcriptional repressor) of toxin-antitoxin stability system
MIKVNIHEAKTHMSRFIERVIQGDTIILCKRNVPVAEIRGIKKDRKTERPIGLAKGTFQVPDDFFEPLPEDILSSFND